MTERLTERTIYDSSGPERVPFDGRVPARSDSRIPHRTATRNHSAGCSSNPEVGCICGYDEGEHPDAEPADGYCRARFLVPGQTALIHGGVRVTVLSVQPYEQTDSFVPSEPWVTLHYRWAMDTQGETMAGRWSLPASQVLRVVE